MVDYLEKYCKYDVICVIMGKYDVICIDQCIHISGSYHYRVLKRTIN